MNEFFKRHIKLPIEHAQVLKNLNASFRFEFNFQMSNSFVILKFSCRYFTFTYLLPWPLINLQKKNKKKRYAKYVGMS